MIHASSFHGAWYTEGTDCVCSQYQLCSYSNICLCEIVLYFRLGFLEDKPVTDSSASDWGLRQVHREVKKVSLSLIPWKVLECKLLCQNCST